MNYRLIFITLPLFTLLIMGCAAEVSEEAQAPDMVDEMGPAEVLDMPAVDEAAVSEEEGEAMTTMEMEVPQAGIVIPRNEYEDVEQNGMVGADSLAYLYMIRPNDHLTGIAFKEYGNPNEWRRIYSWNRNKIGDDPNYILPYHELDLYKPSEEVFQADVEYRSHEVVTGESLWSIAGFEYGDQRAWVILFWDNEEAIRGNNGTLRPGMILRIRTRLW